MKYFSYLIAFLISLPLIAEVTNRDIYIGNFSPSFKEYVASNFNSDIYNIFLNRLQLEPPQSPCDDMNDTTLGCDWSTIPWCDSIAHLTLPDYPNCHLLVIYKVRICPNNPLIRQIHLVTYAVEFPNYTDCLSLANYLNTGTDEEKILKQREIRDKIYFSISEHEAEQIASFSPCDSLGNYLPQYIFYKEACKSIILLNIEYHSVMYSIYEDVACNTEPRCCKTSISFCKDSLGNVNSQITKEIIGTLCDGYPSSLDYQYILDYYIAANPYAVSTSIVEILPCMNVCD